MYSLPQGAPWNSAAVAAPHPQPNAPTGSETTTSNASYTAQPSSAVTAKSSIVKPVDALPTNRAASVGGNHPNWPGASYGVSMPANYAHSENQYDGHVTRRSNFNQARSVSTAAHAGNGHFQPAYYPVVGAQAAAYGAMVPAMDWNMHHNGQIISDQAKRMPPFPMEAEDGRPKVAYPIGGPGMGCRMCLVFPRVTLYPCEHNVCAECATRFMNFSTGMYCSCGTIVTGMINLNMLPNSQQQQQYLQQYFAQPFLIGQQDGNSTQVGSMPRSYGPVQMPPNIPTSFTGRDYQAQPRYQKQSDAQSIRTDASTRGSEANPRVNDAVTRMTKMSLRGQSQASTATGEASNELVKKMNQSSHVTGVQSFGAIGHLKMDAETVIENAPFRELGRHCLAQNWYCIRIANIPYGITSEDILEFLGKNARVVPEEVGMSVHIIMDRASGKTMDAFVEFTDQKDAAKNVARKTGKVLGTRHVEINQVDPADLMREIFPRARGVTWDGVVPKLPAEATSTKVDFVTKEELVLIVGHARAPHRSPFSRKCLQRPYECLLSIVAKFPWFAVSMYTIRQRDIIFDALLTCIDLLKRNCKRGRTTPNLDVNLLRRLCAAGIRCAGFTARQKADVFKIGEFGAEHLVTEYEGEVPGFGGVLALIRKPEADPQIIEMFKEFPIRKAQKDKEVAKIEAPTQALIENLDDTEQPQTRDALPSHVLTTDKMTEELNNHLSGYSMNEMAEMEWDSIERYVRSILPPRAASKDSKAVKAITASADT